MRCSAPLVPDRGAAHSARERSSATSQRYWMARSAIWLIFRVAAVPAMIPRHLEYWGTSGAQVRHQRALWEKCFGCQAGATCQFQLKVEPIFTSLPGPCTVPKPDVTVRLVDGNNTKALAGRLEVSLADLSSRAFTLNWNTMGCCCMCCRSGTTGSGGQCATCSSSNPRLGSSPNSNVWPTWSATSWACDIVRLLALGPSSQEPTPSGQKPGVVMTRMLHLRSVCG